jgi:UDP-N-acetylglucosamine 2-epimerase (hydrolysing)
MKKRIIYLTGTRADFGKLKRLIELTSADSDFEVHIFATGMHMSSKYGRTVEEIQRCGYKNIYTYINMNADHVESMDVALANTIHGFSAFVKEIEPDLIVVHGDRPEALAGAIVGSMNNLLVAHVEGGELSGTVDELVRHAVTKMSHLHFVSHDEAKKRLLQLGELPQSVHAIGSPDIDIIFSPTLPPLEEAKRHYGISFDSYSVFMFHPVTTELGDLDSQCAEVFAALKESGKNFVAIYPNNDTGSDTILNALLSAAEGNPKFRIFPSLRFEYFLTILKNAEMLIGNSSSGIIEAPYMGLPVINIGTRQNGRCPNPSTLHVSPARSEILSAIRQADRSKIEPSKYYGDGKSGERFIRILKTPEFWNVNPQKQFQQLGI